MTVWKYNRIVGHSRCQECGGSYSASNELSEEEIKRAAKDLMPWIQQ